jgi:3-oxoacyl-[acyl-carrier-protein] synthase-3
LPAHNLFHMEGPKLFRFAAKHAHAVVQEQLDAVGWKAAELNALVPHQASAHALRSIARACGFAPAQVLENIAVRGNCLAASIPLLLSEACIDGRIRPGDRVLMAGTAAGVTIGAMAFIR